MSEEANKTATMIEAVADTIGQARPIVRELGLSAEQSVAYCEAITRQAANHIRAIYQMAPKRTRRRKSEQAPAAQS